MNEITLQTKRDDVCFFFVLLYIFKHNTRNNQSAKQKQNIFIGMCHFNYLDCEEGKYKCMLQW